jgi:hypothetical protein
VQIGEDVAARRLANAKAEQARLSEARERAAGTPAEMASVLRLQALDLKVAICDHTLNGIRRSQRRVAQD